MSLGAAILILLLLHSHRLRHAVESVTAVGVPPVIIRCHKACHHIGVATSQPANGGGAMTC